MQTRVSLLFVNLLINEVNSHVCCVYRLIIQRKVSHIHKAFAWLCIILIGITSVTLSVQFSMKKSYYWQITLIVNYTCALAGEVFIYESWNSFFRHCFLPYAMFSHEIMPAIQTLYRVTAGLLSKDRKFVPQVNVLDSPQYLFVSTAVAKEFPHLIESAIVNSYHSIFPGNSGSEWANLAPPSKFDSYFKIITNTVARFAKKYLNVIFEFFPLGCQTVVIHSVLPTIVAMLLFHGGDKFAKVVIGMIFGVTFVSLNLLYFCFNAPHCLQARQMSLRKTSIKVAPSFLTSGGEGDETPLDILGHDLDHKNEKEPNMCDVSYYLTDHKTRSGSGAKKEILKIYPDTFALESTLITAPSPLPVTNTNTERDADIRVDGIGGETEYTQHVASLPLHSSAPSARGEQKSSLGSSHDKTSRVSPASPSGCESSHFQQPLSLTPYQSALRSLHTRSQTRVLTQLQSLSPNNSGSGSSHQLASFTPREKRVCHSGAGRTLNSAGGSRVRVITKSASGGGGGGDGRGRGNKRASKGAVDISPDGVMLN